VIATFAYEYRPASATSHRVHADLMFSRTGVARIGTTAPVWDRVNRCFTNQMPGAAGTIAVMPARYAAFLAEERVANRQNLSVVGTWSDDGRVFLYPIKKLFDGNECIDGTNLNVQFREYHRCEKLRRIVTIGKLSLAEGFNPDAAPLLRESGVGEALVRIERFSSGGTAIVSSPPAPIVRAARQHNSKSGKTEIVNFWVPPAGLFFKGFSINRRYTSLMIVENWWRLALEQIWGWWTGRYVPIAQHNAPNFVNIRHEVRELDGEQIVVDLNEPDALPAGQTYNQYISNGKYYAAMFEDSVCDGSIWAVVSGLVVALDSRPAYSIVAAPDFFAHADELDLFYHFPAGDNDHQFKGGGPNPLCQGRFPINPSVLMPQSSGEPAIDQGNATMVAVIGRPKAAATAVQPSRFRGGALLPWNTTSTYLTDAASNEFAPGWDITFSGEGSHKFYATFGLGSPFPEDMKLCAAANSFWPAASPDASRTFQRSDTPTAIPMLDDELGYHPDNPDRPSDGVVGPGWDGEFGPFFEYVNGRRVVNFADIWRSDYVANALHDGIKIDPFKNVDSAELILRMDCLRFCVEKLPEMPHQVSSTRLWLVTAQKVRDWSVVPDSIPLDGPGYKYVFSIPENATPNTVKNDPKRQRQLIHSIGYLCYVTESVLYWSTDGNKFYRETR
jgi:hypothetical protein